MNCIKVIIFLCIPVLLSAQHPYYINYTYRDGLPTNELFWVIQGSKGDLWLGTDLGLVRFDGQRFERYLNTQVQNKSISAIYEDDMGTIWCSNFANQVFYVENDSLYLFEEWEKVKQPNFNYQNFTRGATANELIIEYEIGLAKTIGKGPVTLFSVDSARAYLQVDAEQSLVFFMNEGYKQKNRQVSSSIHCPDCFYKEIQKKDKTERAYPSSKLIRGSKKVFALIQQYSFAKGRLTNKKGILSDDDQAKIPYLFEIQGDSMLPVYFPDEMQKYEKSLTISNYNFESERILWLATNYGAFRWDIHNSKVQHFFQNQYISDVFYDREGSVWCTSLTNGLYFIPDLRIRTLNTQVEGQRPTALAASPSGLIAIGYSNGKIELLRNHPNQTKHLIRQQHPTQIETIKYDSSKGYLWIGSKYTTVLDTQLREQKVYTKINSSKKIEFDTLNNVILYRGHLLSIIPSPPTTTLYLPKGWKSTYEKQITTRSDMEEMRPRDCCHKSYTGLVQYQPDYQIWCGFHDNLYLFHDEGYTIVTHADKSRIIATDMVATPDGSIWLGTFSEGLLQIKAQKVVQRISMNEGLPDVFVNKIIADGTVLWLATPKGVVKFDTKDQSLIVYDEYYGVPKIKINDMMLVGHQLYLTGYKQVLSFDTRIQPNEVAAPVIRLDNWWINDQVMQGKTVENLDPQQNSIRIQLSAISFRSQGKYQYKYRLKGLEEDWIFAAGNNNEIRYSSLPPGDYRFEAYIVNKWGAQSPEPVVLSFLIPPAFYQTVWFIVSMALLGLLLISLVFLWQLRRLEKRNREKLERSNLESQLRVSQLKALKAQMNPHFIFNALNSIQGLYAMDDQLKANTQLSKFSQLVRRTLDMSNETYIPLQTELEILKLYLEIEQTRFMGELDYEFSPPENIELEEIRVPSLLIQPYVENAVKHGLLHKEGAKKVEVKMEFFRADQILSVHIEDNGVGREASAKINEHRKDHKSFASSANATRLALLNEERKKGTLIGVKYIDKKDNKGQALGTTVIINIPINHESNYS